MAISRAAVIGAGTMGSGIAAHIANAGVPVTLLDLGDAAHAAVQRMATQQPPPLVTRRAARLITPGSLDDLDLVADADWIVEAVVEDVVVKRGLYERLEEARRPGSIVSSNTSTIPLAELLASAPPSLAPDFMITHFFNPPRTMRLLEVVAGAPTRPEAVETITRFADVELGKTIVHCKDTPAFVANRVGCYWMACALAEAIARGLTVEEADALMGAPIGAPRTGVFGLLDLVGLPLFVHLTASLDRLLPADDPWRSIADHTDLFERMVAQGLSGRASGGGFYRRDKGARLALDFDSLEYRPATDPRLAAIEGRPTLRSLVDYPDRYGEYARAVLTKTLAYTAWLVPQIADSVSQIDLAMQLGFGWKHGPFAMADELGPVWLAAQLRGEKLPTSLAVAVAAGSFYELSSGSVRELAPDGSRRPVPRPHGALHLRDVKQQGEPLAANDAGAVWDLGDGAACLELQTKMNAIDPSVFELIELAVATVTDRCQALVVHNEGVHFSVGANLKYALELPDADAWDEFMQGGQDAFTKLKRAPFPVVGAPHGMCLGGGCEVLLHCDRVQAHTETFMGLVENQVGIVPGWGGCKEMLLRAFAYSPIRGPMPPVRQVFDLIRSAAVSTSADHARELGFLRPHDRVTRNRDRVLADAKTLALELADGYVPPEPVTLNLPGPAGRATLVLDTQHAALRGGLSEHDLLVAGELARLVTGSDTDLLDPVEEHDLLALEREVNRTLATTEPTRARIAHMLATGKPLRN